MKLDAYQKTIYTLEEAAKFFQDEAMRNRASLANPDQVFTTADVVGKVLSGELWASVQFLNPIFVVGGETRAVTEREAASNELSLAHGLDGGTADWQLIDAKVSANLQRQLSGKGDWVERAKSFVGGFGSDVGPAVLTDGAHILLPAGLGRLKLLSLLDNDIEIGGRDVLVIADKEFHQDRPGASAIAVESVESNQPLVEWPSSARIVFTIGELKNALFPLSDEHRRSYKKRGGQIKVYGSIADFLPVDKAVDYVAEQSGVALDDEILLGKTVNEGLDVCIELAANTPARKLEGVSVDRIEQKPEVYGVELSRTPIGVRTESFKTPTFGYGPVCHLSGAFRLLNVGYGSLFLREKYELAPIKDLELDASGGFYVEHEGGVFEIAVHKAKHEYLHLCSCGYLDCENNYFTLSGHPPDRSRLVYSKRVLGCFFGRAITNRNPANAWGQELDRFEQANPDNDAYGQKDVVNWLLSISSEGKREYTNKGNDLVRIVDGVVLNKGTLRCTINRERKTKKALQAEAKPLH